MMKLSQHRSVFVAGFSNLRDMLTNPGVYLNDAMVHLFHLSEQPRLLGRSGKERPNQLWQQLVHRSVISVVIRRCEGYFIRWFPGEPLNMVNGCGVLGAVLREGESHILVAVCHSLFHRDYLGY